MTRAMQSTVRTGFEHAAVAALKLILIRTEAARRADPAAFDQGPEVCPLPGAIAPAPRLGGARRWRRAGFVVRRPPSAHTARVSLTVAMAVAVRAVMPW